MPSMRLRTRLIRTLLPALALGLLASSGFA